MSDDPLENALQAMRELVVLEIELEDRLRELRQSYAERIASARERARNAALATARSIDGTSPSIAALRSTRPTGPQGERIPGGPENTTIVQFLRSKPSADVGTIATHVFGGDEPEHRRFISAHLTTLKVNGFVELVSRGVWRATSHRADPTIGDNAGEAKGSATSMEDAMDPP